MTVLRIPYEAEDFPSGTLQNGQSNLEVSWNDILWAAVTVGRPNLQYVFKHGDASAYEALFRWSLVRMALEQSGPRASRLRRTAAATMLDPTEKGAVNYFLGMTVCKLFADKLLNTPWLLHLDVFREHLHAVLTQRSRPDLVGCANGCTNGQEIWHAFECKGRISPPTQKVKDKAKEQAVRIESVNGSACTLHIGAVTYFRNNVLHFHWRDPPPEARGDIVIKTTPDVWRHYYAPVLETIRRHNPDALGSENPPLVPVAGADLTVGVHRLVARPLAAGQWEEARGIAADYAERIAADGYQRDGLFVRAGDSWSQRFSE